MARHAAPPRALGAWPRGLGVLLAGLVVVALGWHFWHGKRAPLLTNAPPKNQRIACFGDSLVAGVGASQPANSYPGQLATLLGREVRGYGKAATPPARAWHA